MHWRARRGYRHCALGLGSGPMFSELRPGDKAMVVGFRRCPRLGYCRRLHAMGIMKGTEFMVKRIAPLGDPVEVEVMGYRLVLRKSEADMLDIRKVN